MKISLILIALASLVLAPARAAPPTAPPREDCGAQQIQPEMNACYGRELDRANADLNGAYAGVIKGLSDDPKGVGLLRAAERAWVDFREKSCAFQARAEEGGSLYPTIVETCEIKMTQARTKEIEAGN
jgi:uncharacterized protein YecT (DUF1311 family)